MPQHPFGLLAAAHDSYRSGDRGGARRLLAKIPAWLSSRYGEVRDIGAVFESLVPLKRWFDAAMAAAIEGGDAQDLRLLAELRRDALDHARRARVGAGQDTSVFLALSDEQIACLAPSCGGLGVLEWLDVSDTVSPLLTVIRSDRTVRSSRPDVADLDIIDISERMGARLQNWRPGRRGDPFDLEGWRQVEVWLLDMLRDELAPGDHIVFLDHAELLGLPWHVAASPCFPSSYASGWRALLALGDPPRPPPGGALGVVMVPRFGEHEEVVEVLSRSAERTASFARRLDLPCLSPRVKKPIGPPRPLC
jgi:hypothetical protein